MTSINTGTFSVQNLEKHRASAETTLSGNSNYQRAEAHFREAFAENDVSIFDQIKEYIYSNAMGEFDKHASVIFGYSAGVQGLQSEFASDNQDFILVGQSVPGSSGTFNSADLGVDVEVAPDEVPPEEVPEE